jgi:uncharacterized repeat protein (TIGR01451 family)
MFSRHSTRRLVTAPRVVLASAVIFAAVPAYFAQSASAGVAAVPGNFFVVTDQGLVNDVVGQGDVTQMGRDDLDPTYLKIFWSWDDATPNGANTLDACALLDVNGNGKIDAAVCGSAIAGAGATVLQNGAPTVSTCDDAWTDRCGQPAAKAQAAGDVTSGALGSTTPPAASPPADLVTATDPFAGGSDAPNDTSLEVHIKKAYLPAAALVNVCSYPSSGAGGINTDPKDCIINPGGGGVQVTKTVTGAPPAGLNPFLIDLTCGANTTQLSLTQNTVGSTSSLAIPEVAGTKCSVNETAAHAQGATASYSGAATAANQQFTIAPGVTSVVTVTNNFPVPDGHVQVVKTVAGAPPAGLNNFSIDVTCGPGAGTTHTYTFNQTTVGTSAAQPAAPGQAEPDGTSCTVNETNPQGATVTYSGAQTAAAGHFTIVGGQTSTVTVTNTYAPIVIPPPPPGNAVLGVTKSSVPASGSFVKPGDSIVYTLAYSNTGNAVATGVTLTDTLPADLDYVAGTATAPGQYDSATRTLSWALGNVPVGGNGTVSFTAQVANTATNGEVLHNVGVINSAGVSDPSNADDVTVTVPTGALTLTKAVDKTSANYGDTVTYTLVASATGQVDQTNVKVDDGVPTGTTYVDNSASCASPCTASQAGGTVTWNVGTLTAGSSATLTFKVTIDKPAAAADGSLPTETVNNSGTAGSDQDPSVASNQVSTTVVQVLGVKVTRKPTVKGEKQTRLPFTGMPFPLWQVLGISLAMLMLGSALSFGMRQPRPVEEPTWRDV